jgi:hypothetical protein
MQEEATTEEPTMNSYEALHHLAGQRRAALVAEAELRRMSRAARRGRRVRSIDATRTRGAPVPPDLLVPAGT